MLRTEEVFGAAWEMVVKLRATYAGGPPYPAAIATKWIELELLSRGINVDYSEGRHDPFASRYDAARGAYIIGPSDEEDAHLKMGLAKTLGEAVFDASLGSCFRPGEGMTHTQGTLFPGEPTLLYAENSLAFFAGDRDEVVGKYAYALICHPREAQSFAEPMMLTCRRLATQSPDAEFESSWLRAIARDLSEQFVVPDECATFIARFIFDRLPRN